MPSVNRTSFVYQSLCSPFLRSEEGDWYTIASESWLQFHTSQNTRTMLPIMTSGRWLKRVPNKTVTCLVRSSPEQLTTPENTTTYHNALCLSPQNFTYALFSVSLGAILHPKRNWRQCLSKTLGWEIIVALWYVMVFLEGSVVHRRSFHPVFTSFARGSLTRSYSKSFRSFPLFCECLFLQSTLESLLADYNSLSYALWNLTITKKFL